jgi:hypothetical protein
VRGEEFAASRPGVSDVAAAAAVPSAAAAVRLQIEMGVAWRCMQPWLLFPHTPSSVWRDIGHSVNTTSESTHVAPEEPLCRDVSTCRSRLFCSCSMTSWPARMTSSSSVLAAGISTTARGCNGVPTGARCVSSQRSTR